MGQNGDISTDCITSFKYEEKETIQGTDFFVPIVDKANVALKGRNKISEGDVKASYFFDPSTFEFDVTKYASLSGVSDVRCVFVG